MQGGQRRDFVVLRMVLGIACVAVVGLMAPTVALAARSIRERCSWRRWSRFAAAEPGRLGCAYQSQVVSPIDASAQ